ncbi:MAG TPA: tripartite tricarboxylate transporter substrate binding protein [Falsiroseomonas sp.]|jgi:tripartite-type tricarboxylate transporter receptor subunit TctC|nr:tripartite tricarboxylate transporter substrate binding protein [Falsiroseomonas sp.]
MDMVHLRRRSLLAMALLAGPALAVPALAQGARPLRIVVPFPPGGSVDIVSRIAQPVIQELLGATVVIENRSGAGGMIGAGAVAQSAPDGSTVVWGNIATHAINAAVYTRMPYDPVADFTPVTLAARIDFMVSVHPSVPANNVAELVALAKADPRRLTYGSAGAGSLPHLLTEMLKREADGIEIVHVPFRGGGQLLIDLLAGNISMAIADVAGMQPHVRGGRLRGLAVAGAERSSLLPDLPRISETLPGVEGTAWHGVFAPARTPPEIVAKLHAAIGGALTRPDIRARLIASGAEPIGGGPEALAAFQRAEMAKWASIARAVDAKVE